METDKVFIERCFQLARMGAGNVAPNPMVGAVITVNGKIIGEGYHKQYGDCHAEVNAVKSVMQKYPLHEAEALLKQATVYVSLEPCSHYGKTPPCAKLLTEKQIKRCVIANYDPNPEVSGRGIKMLEDAGIEVVCGVHKRKGRFINRRFFCFQEKKRPYIILKTAQSADGFMDINPQGVKEQRKDYWITNDVLKVFVHRMRSENDAFFVGANTVINDDCQLNTRYYNGRNPLRLTYDRNLSIPLTKKFFDNTQKTIIFNNIKNEVISENIEYVKIHSEDSYLREVVAYLYNKGISSLVVEGGRKTLEQFTELDLWDEAVILTGKENFVRGTKTPAIDTRLKASTSWVSDNRIDWYINNKAY